MGAEDKIVAICGKRRFSMIREYLDIILVAGMVAFGLRALFFQPFKIPTSSMQPTLYGIHFVEKGSYPAVEKLPAFLRYLLLSLRDAKAVSSSGGALSGEVKEANSILSESSIVKIGDDKFKLPGSPNKIYEYAKLYRNQYFAPGETIVDGYLSLGDHLFVDRISHFFSDVKRGDVLVFATDGIKSYDGRKLSDTGAYYIKRLVGIPGDTIKFTDGQLMIRPAGEKEFRPAKSFGPEFERIYSFKGGYHGHQEDLGMIPIKYPQSGGEFTVPKDYYYMLGDNSRFSLDSRAWGLVPRKNIVGRAGVIFWPFSRRWGKVDTTPALEVPTGMPSFSTFDVMYKQ